ncbi:hypothetical protein ACHAXT_008518 [Thalassiosira profunda]
MTALAIFVHILCATSFTWHPRLRPPSSHPQHGGTRLCSQSNGSDENANIDNANIDEGIRLNKVFKATHSRREADKLITEGRVSINGQAVRSKGGMKVVPFRDEVALDGQVVRGWERMNALDENQGGDLQTAGGARGGDLNTAAFEYVKYFKPRGVTCTTDRRIEGNIIDAIHQDGFRPRHRVYPVGRLDKDTTGLILLTSDGRMVNAVLRGERKQPKVYKVMVNGRLEEGHLQQLRDGVVIKTVAQRKGRTEEENTLVARTKPCICERIGPSACQMTLVEGRNRQIRKMMEALGLRVVKLHRVEFMGIRLGDGGLGRPGDWAYLDEDEMALVEEALRSAGEGD